MTGNKLVAVVVTHNRRGQLRRCLNAILSQEDGPCDIIVLDNGSTDGTGGMVEGEFGFPEVRYYNAGSNTGSAGGFHLGVYAAVLSGYDLIWVMDDDVIPERNALAELLEADRLLNGEWGFLSSVACWTDGSVCKANIQKKGLLSFVRGNDYSRGVTKIKIAAMASLMLRADIVRKVGLPIADYFIYTDDYEYTERISRVSPCYMVASSRVTHDMERNSKVNLVSDSSSRLWRYQYLYRNDVHFYRRFGLRGWAYLIGKTGYTATNVLLNERERPIEKLGILFGGLVNGICFSPQIERV